MLRTLWVSLRTSPITVIVGALIGTVVVAFRGPLGEIGYSMYDAWDPVVTEWRVEDVKIDGPDVVVSGAMVKNRGCVFVPPTVARDETGFNYTVESTARTAGKTWAPSSLPQKFGPWRAREAASSGILDFFNVYMCGNGASGRPTVVYLGRLQLTKRDER